MIVSAVTLRSETHRLVGRHKSRWHWLAGKKRIHSLTEMVASEMLLLQGHLPETKDQLSDSIRDRVKERLRASEPGINPIMLFVIFQVLGQIISIAINYWWEKWKGRDEDEDEDDEPDPA